MKNIIRITVLCIIILFGLTEFNVVATDKNEILNAQSESLNISSFIKESEKYTKEFMPGVDLNELLSAAITGSIDNVKLIHLFFNLFGKEFLNSLMAITGIIAVIIIHSILKGITDRSK